MGARTRSAGPVAATRSRTTTCAASANEQERGHTRNVGALVREVDVLPECVATGLLWAETGFRPILPAEGLPRLAAISTSSCPVSDIAGQPETCRLAGKWRPSPRPANTAFNDLGGHPADFLTKPGKIRGLPPYLSDPTR